MFYLFVYIIYYIIYYMSNLTKYNNTYVILEKNYKIYNPKIHDLLNIYFNQYYIIKYLNKDDAITFINNNSKNNIKIIFYFQNMPNFGNNLLEFIKNKIDLKCNIFFFTFDFWIRNPSEFKFFITNIYKASNYKVFSFAYNLEQINHFHNINYDLYKNNIIFNNIWCSYESSFLDFNKIPINKLFISGAITSNYPERQQISTFNNIIIYSYNNSDVKNNTDNYNIELNKYIACFSSSVYITSLTTNKYENTHTILQKNFEILASGSLLVVPLDEEKYLNDIGLYHKENCYLIDFNKNIQEQINYIFNNLEIINKIRFNGYTYSKDKFNSYLKFIEINNIIQKN
jgi:hypothetical protein